MAFQLKRRENDVSEEASKERSYLWMVRVFGLISVVTFVVNLILFSALNSLLPTVRVQPFFISTQDKDRQIISVQRMKPEILRSDVLQESFVRQYLMARLGVGADVAELERRWGPDGTIQWMSSDSTFSTFLKTLAEPLIKLAREEGLTRDVQILNVTPIPRSDGVTVWQAEVRLREMSRTLSEPLIMEVIATMSIGFGRLREGLSWKDRLQNPLGFQVIDYGEKIKKVSETGVGTKKM